ncbi:MAG: aminomethyl-transferring glycine dehydrogenase [Candidatus Dasytiphilus stammeri]
MIKSLNHLEDNFILRHIGPSGNQQKSMLSTIKMSSLKELISAVVPPEIQLTNIPNLCDAVPAHVALSELKMIAKKNKIFKSLIGMGYYGTILPQVILRNVLENPGWYTAYTPYQPEISQGRLEALLNFQQITVDLTGLPIASASLLDEATAAAEAMSMSKRISKIKNNKFFIANDVHPQTIDVIKTRASTLEIDIIIDNPDNALIYQNQIFGILFQYIGTTGKIHNFTSLIAKLKKKQIIISVAADLMSLVILKGPGTQGADIVFGSAQRFGLPMGYGGPHAAFYATREEYKRSMPGRIIGVSRDKLGNIAFRMALQTREQHIRREKATSNICTSQALLAIIAGFYAVYHGPKGLQKIATRINRLTDILAVGLQIGGLKLLHHTWFDTLTIKVENKNNILLRALKLGINLRSDLNHAVGITLDETTTRQDIMTLFTIFLEDGHGLDPIIIDQYIKQQNSSISLPLDLLRTEDILTHIIFNSFHSETAMMRYLHTLECKDIALNYSMIPLGSCTMKLNAAVEMIPLSWPEFCEIHPFCPKNQIKGYVKLIHQLCNWLQLLTGYNAFSLQPNSGAQGEYAGLLTIRRYHESRNENNRNICLIPNSAHGTNPASATMVGMKVIPIKCDNYGNIELNDLLCKIEQSGKNLSCLMITYPSTYGLFEENIPQICQLIHDNGGQVYLDGANMNAQLGITNPCTIGADVAHLNLHKTFCIPHGGGGPGLGPIGVKKHLINFLPGHKIIQIKGLINSQSAVSAAPFGSASLFPICWMYIRMMGHKGLRLSSEIAILNANYIAKKITSSYPILYTGRNNLVGHECIIDIRPLKFKLGIGELDIAKRLIDYGFHAPTISFPVPGTMMIEPTESENKIEIDNFLEAMISIRQEINFIEKGYWPLDDNPLINAPHTQDELTEKWNHAYSIKQAFFPLKIKNNKYWPPVKRLNDIFGDKNLCTSYPLR